jgi:hypothetical protein
MTHTAARRLQGETWIRAGQGRGDPAPTDLVGNCRGAVTTP